MPRAQAWLTLLASAILLVGAVCSVVPSFAITHWVAKEGFLSPSPIDLLNSEEVLANITKLIRDVERRDIGVMALLSQVHHQKPALSCLTNVSTNRDDQAEHTPSSGRRAHNEHREERQPATGEVGTPEADALGDSCRGGDGDDEASREIMPATPTQAREVSDEQRGPSQDDGKQGREDVEKEGEEAIIAVEMRTACDSGACAPFAPHPDASTCQPRPSSLASSPSPSEHVPHCGSGPVAGDSETATAWRIALQGTCTLPTQHSTSTRGAERSTAGVHSWPEGSSSSSSSSSDGDSEVDGCRGRVEDEQWRWMLLSYEDACRQDEDPLIALATHPLSTSAVAVCGPPPPSAAYDYLPGMKQHLSTTGVRPTSTLPSPSPSSRASVPSSVWHWLPPVAVPEVLLTDVVPGPQHTSAQQQHHQQHHQQQRQPACEENHMMDGARQASDTPPTASPAAHAQAFLGDRVSAAAARYYEDVRRVKHGGVREPASLVAAARTFAALAKDLQEAEERGRLEGREEGMHKTPAMQSAAASLPTAPLAASVSSRPTSTAAAAASVHCLRNALEKDPLFRPGLLALGKTMLAKGFTLDAERLFTRATRPSLSSSSPSPSSFHSSLPSASSSWNGGNGDTKAAAHYWLARTLQQQGRYDRALREYDAALALDPTMKHAAYRRANLITEMRGRTDRPLLLQTLLLIACASALTLLGVYVFVVRQQPQPQPSSPADEGEGNNVDGKGTMAAP